MNTIPRPSLAHQTSALKAQLQESQKAEQRAFYAMMKAEPGDATAVEKWRKIKAAECVAKDALAQFLRKNPKAR